MVRWNNLGESLAHLLIEQTPAEDAARRGLKSALDVGGRRGDWIDSGTKMVVARTVKGKLVRVDPPRPVGGEAGDAEKTAEKTADRGAAGDGPRDVAKDEPSDTKRRVASTEQTPKRAKNKVTEGGDADIKNKVIESGFVKGVAAPGNAASAMNEIMTGEAMHLVRQHPKLAENPEAIAELLQKQYGESKLFKQQGAGLKKKLLATVRTGITEAQRLNEGLRQNGWDDAKVDHYYGAKDSIAAMTEAISNATTIISPTGDKIPSGIAMNLVRNSGSGENPSDTAVFAKHEDGSLMIMFTSNKIATSDNQANSTLNSEFDNTANILKDLGKSGQYSPDQIRAGSKAVQKAQTEINAIEKNLRPLIVSKTSGKAAFSSEVRAQFLQNVSKLAPGDQKRWEAVKNKLEIEDDEKAAAVFFKGLADTGNPTENEAKLITRGLDGIPGIPSAAEISATQRGQIIDIVSKTRKAMDQITDKNGIGLGTSTEAQNLVDKLHLGTAFKGSDEGVNAFGGLFEVNMGGIRLTEALLSSYIGNNELEFIKGFSISDPIPVKDKAGNITGAKAEIFAVDKGGKKHKLAIREVRSKQGITGKLETTYKWHGDAQRFFKSGGETKGTNEMKENLNGPGQKTKSGGVARGGRISQKSNQDGRRDRDGAYGTGAGVAGPEPQAQSGQPNPDEDELEKDYLEMDDEPLQPQSPLGKLIAQEFDQPIGEPKGEESDEEPDEKQPVGEASSASGRKFVTSLVSRSGEVKGRFEKDPGMGGAVYLTHTYKNSGKSFENRFSNMAKAKKAWKVLDGRSNHPWSSAKNEDYQGDTQTVTDTDGKELDIDEDAYETAQKTEPTEVQQMDAAFTVQTKEGPADGKAGDYLARGVDGEQWPIDQAIFDKTHEFVDPEIQTEVKGLAAPDFETEVEIDEAGWIDPREKAKGRVFINVGRDGTLRYAVSDGRKGGSPQRGRDMATHLQKLKDQFKGYEIQVRDDYGDLGEDSLSNVTSTGDNKWAAVRRKDGKPVTVTVPKEGKEMTAAQVHDKSLRDPKFRAAIAQAHKDIKSKSKAKVKFAFDFLQKYDLLGLTYGTWKPKTWQDVWKGEAKISGGGPRSMKRTSGSTEWGRTRKTGKTSKSNLRRSATKKARQAGKKQARQMDEGTVLKVRPDLWAAKNALGEVKHFTAPKIATMFANSKGKDNFGAGILEAVGGRWASQTRHFQPEGDADAKTLTRGMVSVDEEGSSEFLGKDTLSPDEMKIIDTNWKKILKLASAAFKAHPLPVALRAIEAYLEKLGVDESHTMKIGEILAAQLNKDRDPTSMIIPKVIPKIQQEPYTKSSGYSAGGSGGMGPTR